MTERERLTGHPSDYGGRTLEDEEQARTADGEPLNDRGSVDSANGAPRENDDEETEE